MSYGCEYNTDGSLPELVHDGETGLTFEYANVESLRAKVAYMLAHTDEAKTMGEKAYTNLVGDYSPNTHYEKLMRLFGILCNNHP